MTTQITTALITGASSGIGAVYADRLAARGANLVLVARREDRLKTLAADLRARYGVAVDILVADLSDEAGIRAVEEELRSNTAIDTLVNNAGTAQMAPFLAGEVAQHQAINTLNTTALMRLTYAILPRLAQNNRGTELYPRTAGRICRQQRAHSGRAARRDRDGDLEPFWRHGGRSAGRIGDDHRRYGGCVAGGSGSG